jgi:hypothetical protein
MDQVKELDTLEDQFYGDWEEERSKLVAALKPMHEAADADDDERNAFALRTMNRFGGAFIPYLFWKSLKRFVENPNNERPYIQGNHQGFCGLEF